MVKSVQARDGTEQDITRDRVAIEHTQQRLGRNQTRRHKVKHRYSVGNETTLPCSIPKRETVEGTAERMSPMASKTEPHRKR